MQTANASLFSRGDTLFGVCQALGEDFGFDPLYLRVTLGVLLLWNPVVPFAAYAALAVVVMLSRLVFPKTRRSAAVTQADADGKLPAPANEAAEELAFAA